MEISAMKSDALIPFLIFTTIAVAFFIFIVAQSRKWQRKFEEIAGALGGEAAGGFLQSSRYVKVVNSGREQRIRVLPGGKDRPSYLSLEQIFELDFDLSITKENFIGRGLEKLGLRFETKVGDPEFDNKYSVTSRAKEKAQMFLLSSERRMIVDSIFKDGFNCVKVAKGMAYFQKPLFDQNLDPAALKNQLDLLRKFTTGQ
jgi:hypothetical protein